MTIQPKPTRAKPDTALYERMESRVRSYARSLPRQFGRAEGVWMHDDRGGAISIFCRAAQLSITAIIIRC